MQWIRGDPEVEDDDFETPYETIQKHVRDGLHHVPTMEELNSIKRIEGIDDAYWPPTPVPYGADPEKLGMTVQAMMVIDKVWFHNSNCQTPKEDRPSSVTDAECHPCGGFHSVRKPFPLDTIIRTAYNDILDEVNSVQDLSKPPIGYKILTGTTVVLILETGGLGGWVTCWGKTQPDVGFLLTPGSRSYCPVRARRDSLCSEWR